MKDEQEFYRCLVSDVAGRALLRIRDILSDETLNDTACFYKIEAIISLLNDMGIFTGTPRFLIKKHTAQPCAFCFGMFPKRGDRSPPLCVLWNPGRIETPWCFPMRVKGGGAFSERLLPLIGYSSCAVTLICSSSS